MRQQENMLSVCESLQLFYSPASTRSNQPVWGLQPGCPLCSGLSGATQREHTVQSSYSMVWRTNWQLSLKTTPNFSLTCNHAFTSNHKVQMNQTLNQLKLLFTHLTAGKVEHIFWVRISKSTSKVTFVTVDSVGSHGHKTRDASWAFEKMCLIP